MSIDDSPAELLSSVPGGGLRHLLNSSDSRESVLAGWRLEAACRGMDTALFFPERGQPAAAARETCARCPVAAQCAEYAIAGCEKFGLWGNTTVRERSQIRRQRRTQPKETAA